VITKPDQHEIDRAGKRLLRGALEPLKWVVNLVEEDYGIDCNVQVFDERVPTGAWFHVQLKSSASSEYSASGTFVSQKLEVDRARHYALEMRDPVFLIHADVESGRLFWHAPQVDRHLASVLRETHASSVTVRVPTSQRLPDTAPDLLARLNEVYLVLGSRTVTAASAEDFVMSVAHLPDQEAAYQAFQEKATTLKVQKILDLFHGNKYQEARSRADAVVIDPDCSVEARFWAQMTLQSIDFAETLRAGKPQRELHESTLAHARKLQRLTKSGPRYLKFYSLISKQAAELEVLGHEEFSLFMALRAHLERHGNPMLVLGLFAKRSAVTKRLISKYNQCIRLARYAATYPDRWMLGRALANIARALGPYMVTLREDEKPEIELAFTRSALQILGLAVRICGETGDSTGVVLAISAALSTAGSKDSEAFRWAKKIAEGLVDKKSHEDAALIIERTLRRWNGEIVAGDYAGDTVWQAIQNIASGLGLDLSDEEHPLVRGLRIAATDDSPERILANCDHLLVTQGAIGPIARQIQSLFNTSRASSKVIHCTLYDFHLEAKEQDKAYNEFKPLHCEACPDSKPRPDGWRLTPEEDLRLRARHSGFVRRLVGTPFAPRLVDED
jgi:hypothetical protein